MPRCSYGRTKSGRCKKKPGPKKGSKRAPSGSRPCARGRTKSGRCKKKPGPKRSSSGRSSSGRSRRSASQRKWMAHVKRYAKEHGVTIREAMKMACATYPTGCRGRRGSIIPDAPVLGYEPSQFGGRPLLAPTFRGSRTLGDDLRSVRSRLKALPGVRGRSDFSNPTNIPVAPPPPALAPGGALRQFRNRFDDEGNFISGSRYYY